MIDRTQKICWFGAAGLCLAACWLLGLQELIGKNPLRAGVLHVLMMSLMWPIIRWFPFQRKSVLAILIFTIASRLFVIQMTTGDDVNRYVWEGRVLAHGHNPYIFPPNSPELELLRDSHWQSINNKHMTAIYPPGILFLFQQMARFTDSPTTYKYIITFVDVVVVLVLVDLLQQVGRRRAWALLYGLNPIVLLSFAGEGHLDVFLILMMLVSLSFHVRGRYARCFLFFGLSFHMKYISILLLPFLVKRENLNRLWALVIGIAVPFFPFWPCHGMATSLTTFSSDMHFNGSIQRLLGFSLDNFPLASTICAIVLCAWIVLSRIITSRPLEGGALVMSGLLLLSPNVHFWYLTWMIPFLCFYPFRPMLLFCFLIPLSYQTLGHLTLTDVWQEFPTAIFGEYLPIYACLLYVAWRPPLPSVTTDAIGRRSISRLSIVVPVLNEADCLPRFIDHVLSLRGVDIDLVISDGGSTDGTLGAAQREGVRVVHSSAGRGRQVHAGVEAAEGDAVLIAHADMRIDPTVPAAIVNALDRSDSPGGCVGCRFSHRHPFLFIISLLNRLRAQFVGISFGDQGQFARMSAIEKIGGFPSLPIMEDVEFSIRLKSLGRPLYVGGGIVASSRRWLIGSKRQNAFLVVRLVAWYGWRRLLQGKDCQVDDFYHAYYGPREQAIPMDASEGLSKDARDWTPRSGVR